MEINLKFIEQYIYNKYLKGIVSISKNHEKYVMEEDILKLKLTDDEKKYIRKILFDKDIEIRQEPITKKDRSPLVRDNNYGEVKYTEYDKNDKPVYAVLEYDKIGNLIYSDFTKLDEFLDTYIKNNYRCKRKDDDTYEVSIQLNKILKLKLCEKELEHVFEYLNQRNIQVRGYSPNFDSEFINYTYIRRFNSIPFPERIDGYKVEENIELYHKTKDIKLRNEIAEQTMRLVPFVSYNYAMLFDYDINELNSYGYEALLNAIEKFNPKVNYKFSTYAVKCIRGKILSGMKLDKYNARGDTLVIWNKRFYDAKKLYCKDHGYNIYEIDDLEYMDEILSFMYDLGQITYEEQIESIKQLLMFSHVISIDEKLADNDDLDNNLDDDYVADNQFESDYLMYNDEDDFENEELQKILSEQLDEVLDTLTEREQKILRFRFGLDDGRSRTLEEVAVIFNVTRERIRQIEARALRKLRHPSRSRQLRTWLD